MYVGPSTVLRVAEAADATLDGEPARAERTARSPPEIHFLGTRPRNDEWVFEADIAAVGRHVE